MAGPSRYQGNVEVIDLGDRRAEALVTMRALIERIKVGLVVGLMVIVERPRGAYTATDMVMTGCDNAAERVGRIRFLIHELTQLEAAIMVMAREQPEDE